VGSLGKGTGREEKVREGKRRRGRVRGGCVGRGVSCGVGK